MKIWRFTKLKVPAISLLISLGVSLFFVLLSIFLIWRYGGGFPLTVPLWFSKAWGEDRLADPVFLWLLPISALALIFVNLLLSRLFKKGGRMVSLILIWASPVVSGLLFYTLLEIISVVS